MQSTTNINPKLSTSPPINPSITAPTLGSSANTFQLWLTAGAILWVAGIILLVLYSLVSLIRLRQKLVGAIKLHDQIYLADYITSPFVIGLIHPHIYLPSSLSSTEQDYIILHEKTHIKRFDYIAKMIAFTVLILHWFNPLVWLSFHLFSNDMEMSCDEYVLKKMNSDIRREYSASLLSLASGRKILVEIPLAFGEGNIKKRIRNIMNYKKSSTIIVVITVMAILTLSIGLLSNPKQTKVITATYSDQICTITAKIPSNWTYNSIGKSKGNEQTEASPDSGLLLHIDGITDDTIYIYRQDGHISGVDDGSLHPIKTHSGLTGKAYTHNIDNYHEMNVILDKEFYGISMKIKSSSYYKKEKEIKAVLDSISITDAAESTVSSESENLSDGRQLGYIKLNKDNTLTFHPIELITDSGKERIAQLKLTENDMVGDYYIYDSKQGDCSLKIGKNTTYIFIDWGNNFGDPKLDDTQEGRIEKTKVKKEFLRYLDTYTDQGAKVPFWLEIKDGEIVTIEEQYIP